MPELESHSNVNRIVKKMEGFCLKTILDLEACRKVAEESSAKKDAVLQEALLVTSEPAPFKPKQLIETFRPASPCGMRWDEMDGTDIFKVCRQCKLHVYDFSNTEVKEAEKLVLTREGIENPTFYRRADGKFVTSDCPIGVQRRRRTIRAAALVSTLLVAAIAGLILAPKAPAPGKANTPATKPSRTETVIEQLPARPKARNGGAFGIESGQSALINQPATLPSMEPSQSISVPPSAAPSMTSVSGTSTQPPAQTPGSAAGQAGSTPKQESAAALQAVQPVGSSLPLSGGAQPLQPVSQAGAGQPAQGEATEKSTLPNSTVSSEKPAIPYVRYYR